MQPKTGFSVLKKLRVTRFFGFGKNRVGNPTINYVLDLWKLCFLNIQRDHLMPVVRSFYVISGCTSFNDLCIKYGTADVHRSVFCKHVWNVFISSISV